MLKIQTMMIAALLAMASTLGCSQDQKPSKAGLMAKTLDRATALAMIKKATENGQKVVPDTTIHDYTLPMRLTPLGRMQGMPSAQLEILNRTDQANLEFYTAMVNYKLIKEVGCQPPTDHVNCYASIAESFKKYSDVNRDSFDIVVSKPVSTSITGIQQGSNHEVVPVVRTVFVLS